MISHTATARPAAMTSRTAALMSFAAAGTFLVVLAGLHILEPEFDPSWRMVSEYAIGRYGWVMLLAFLSLALSCASLVVAIRSQIQAIGGKIGLGLLLLSAVGITLAGIFPIDPITGRPDEATTHGMLHGVASLLGVPTFPLAAVLISRSLARMPTWSIRRQSLLWTAHLTWVSLLAMVVTLAVTLPQAGGQFGPAVVIGWPNRLMLLAYSAWLMLVALRAVKLSRQQS
jgi:hypothetical protein